MNEKQSILITGANSHIGKGLIEYFKNKGNVRLFLTSRSVNKSLESDENSDFHYLPSLDLLNGQDVDALRSEADQFFDGPFSVIHSVGYFWYHVPFEDVDMVEAKKMMDSHYTTLYGVSHGLLPLMKSKGGGKLIAFSCNSVNYNFPYMAAFTSAKAAVECLIKCIAHEFAQHNVIANTLALSSMQTDAVKASKPYGDYEHYIPIKDLCTTIDELLSLKSNIVNGNVINCYRYSDSYYTEGYFQRIRTK